MVYGHYCTEENVAELLTLDESIFEDSIVLCKYGFSGRPDKPASVKPYGAKAVLQFSDPFDYSEEGETGIDDAGIPWDTVQRYRTYLIFMTNCYLRGKSAYFRGDPTTPGYPSYFGTYAGSIQKMLTEAKNEIWGPHLIAPLPQQPISINDAQYLLSMFADDGIALPSNWTSQSGLKLKNVGGTLPSEMEFHLQIAPNYERFVSQDIIGNPVFHYMYSYWLLD